MAAVYDEEQTDNVQKDLAHREQAAADDSGTRAQAAPSRENVREQETAGAGGQDDGANAGKKQDASSGDDKLGKVAKAKNFLQKHKTKLIVGGGAGVGLLPILAFIMFLLGTLGLPNFFENMLAWRWAHLTRAQLKSTLAVMDTKVVYDAADNNAKDQVNQRYGGLKRLYNGTINVIQPNRIIQNLEQQDRLQYERDGSGRISKVRITDAQGKTSVIELNRSRIITFENGRLQFRPFQMYSNNLDFWRQNRAAMRDALRIEGHGPLASSRAVKSFLRTRLNIGWVGLQASKYKGKTNAEADRTLARDTYNITKDTNGTSAAKSPRINEASQEVNDATQQCVENDKCLDGVIKNKGDMPPEVANTLDRSFDPEALDSVTQKVKSLGEVLVRYVNPVYDIAVPVCMIYDGSRLSPQVINAQSTEVQRSAVLVASTANQQKMGEDINAEALDAMNRKLGDTYDTNIMRMASGKTVNTDNTPSTQTTPLGQTGASTIFDVIFDGAPSVAGAFNGSADSLCPVLTDFWVGVGLGVVNVGVMVVGSIFTGGASGTAQVTASAAAQSAARLALSRLATNFAQKFATKEAFKKTLGDTGRFGKKLAEDTIRWGGATAAATYLAKIIVLSHTGYLHNGLAMDQAFSNDVDNGFEQVGDGIMADTFHGRPQTHAETAQNMAEDRKLVIEQNSERNTFERYFALSNPNSLTTRVAMATTSNINRSAFSSLANSIASIFNPAALFSNIMSPLNSTATAATNVETANYMNVQFDWSQDEYKKIDSSTTYLPLENQLILEQSGKEQEINEKYGPCFKQPIGTLLAEGYIKRTENGDIKNEGLCSPGELSYNNPTYGDLVFRWRLSMFYETGLGVLENIQNPEASTSQAPSTVPTTGGGGWTWPVNGRAVVTDCFGTRGGRHKGIDIAGSLGTPIVAAYDGKVTRSGPASGYGPHFVIIQHPNGKGSSYGHMRASNVNVGDQVRAGQTIGQLGNEGKSTGPHLHFNIFPGSYSGSDEPNENPLKYIKIPSGTPNPKNCSG